MQSIRILLANHQPLVRSGLRLLLEQQPGFQVVAEAANGREVIALAEFSRPDVALLEMELPYINGIAVAHRLSAGKENTKPVFVTAHTEEIYAVEAFKAGARGFVSADSATSDLPRAIRVVNRGRFFLSPAICSQFLCAEAIRNKTSERERELCGLLAAGYDETEIATLLGADIEKIIEECRVFKSNSYLQALPEAVAQSMSSAQDAISNH